MTASPNNTKADSKYSLHVLEANLDSRVFTPQDEQSRKELNETVSRPVDQIVTYHAHTALESHEILKLKAPHFDEDISKELGLWAAWRAAELLQRS